jgi:nucleoside-diphosphate-sugar epimerase
VTGSSGYIGSRLIPHLRSRGHVVRGLDRAPNRSGVLPEFVHGDLLDAGVGEAATRGIDTVVHLAAAKDDWGLTAEEYFRDNLHATRALIRAGRASGVKDWVFFSSVAVMGPSDTPLTEQADFAPTIPYGESKAAAERLFHDLAREDPAVHVVIVRPSGVFGPGNPENTNVFRLIDAIYGNQFVMIGDGSNIKTTSYIENVVAATLFLMDRMRAGVQTLIYVDAPALSTEQLVGILYTLLGKRRAPWRLPLCVARPVAYVGDWAASLTGMDLPITAARIQKFCTSTHFDGSALRRLGFSQPVTNEDALAATVAWYVAQRTGRQATAVIG